MISYFKRYALFCFLMCWAFLLPSFSTSVLADYVMTEEEMAALSGNLEKVRHIQKKQQRESKELRQELAASENALKQARGELSGLMTELEISKKTVEKEKNYLQNVRISFEKYRKEEEQEKARLRRQRNTAWLLAVAALAYGIKG